MWEQVAGNTSLYIGRSARGRNGFDGGKNSRDACRAPSPRKSGGTQRNCGHAARSRGLISRDVPPVFASGAGTDVITGGWSSLAVPTGGDEMHSGLAVAGFRRSSTAAANFQGRLRM